MIDVPCGYMIPKPLECIILAGWQSDFCIISELCFGEKCNVFDLPKHRALRKTRDAMKRPLLQAGESPTRDSALD